MILTQKETSLLEDAKTQEQLCVDKYKKYASEACDSQLKDLFTSISREEQQHLDTVNQLLGGTVPPVTGGNHPLKTAPQPSYGANCNTDDKNHDKFLCGDSLSTEKHVSSIYNTDVFEFRDTNARNVLNHIQKEEQKHGELIYNYMAENGMYN